MRVRSVIVNVRRVIGVVLLFVSANLAFAVRSEWLRAQTDHFEMFSRASESESRRILLALEQFRANFLATFPLRGASEPRTTIVLFDRESQFRPYKPLFEGKPKALAGFFLPGTDEVMIAMTNDLGGGDTDATEVIYHEYVHLLLHAHGAPVPVWLNEGLAELYSTFRIEDKKVEFGAAKDGHVAVLNQSAFMPLAKLFAVTHESPDYNEEQRAGIFYAESWAFVHYLVCGEDKKNAGKLGRFIERLSVTGDNATAFREAFGSDYQPIETALRGYLNGGRYYKRTTPALLPGLDVKFRPATDVERDFALLNLRWRVHQPADTAYRALELLRQQPEAFRPHELLATIAVGEGDLSTAVDHWQAAAERKTDNAYVYVQLVRNALGGFQGGAFLDARLPPERIAELRGWVNRALALTPSNADALEASALIETLAAEFDIPSINRIQSLVMKMREPARTLLALGIIRWRAGDFKTANDIVDVILSERRADMPTRSAAGMLRARLPAPAGGDETGVTSAAPISAEQFAARAAIVLQTGKRETPAQALLDRLLAERGTLAPRQRLPEISTTAAKGNAPAGSAWAAIDAARTRANAGDADAMFALAVAHACGDGAEFSPTLAVEWLERAATAGNAMAVAGMPRNASDADPACQFLRTRRAPEAQGELPPLDGDLQVQIAEAVKVSPRRTLTAVYRATPRFPDEKRRAGVAGDAMAQFQVDPRGQPRMIRIVQSSDPVFAAATEECVRQWRFLPAIRDGKAVPTEVEVPVKFQIAR